MKEPIRSSLGTAALPEEDVDLICVNTIRFLAVDAVQKANSGHPGMPMGAAPMAYVLWTRFLRHNPADPRWFNRDRFVLSAGHGSMLLYALLHLAGYDLPLDEIRSFRQWRSLTPGHPERGLAPGVETTTGPLGQGIANAVGLAIAERHLAARFNRPGFEIIDHRTWSILGDGDLMEGVSGEAASLAGHLGLGRLICLYDDNRVSLSASTELTFTEDRGERFEALGWRVRRVEDGNDLEAIDSALRESLAQDERPSLILVRTHIGWGSPHRQDTFEAHGSPLGEEEVRLTKRRLGWPEDPPFLIPEMALERFRAALDEGRAAQRAWEEIFRVYEREHPDTAAELKAMIAGELPAGWDRDIPFFPADPKGMPTRTAGGKVMNVLAPRVPGLIGGSADLDPSTMTMLRELGDLQNPLFEPADRQGSAGGGWGYAGRNLHFGVREHAMGGILNGLAVHGGLIPFGATFLVFSDYMRPPLRLGALMGLRIIYVFTHDSVGLGEDGPTHQPVEHLAALRAVPGLLVIRPADANETAEAWRLALQTRDRPTALILSRQQLPVLDRSTYAPAEGLRRGAYVLSEAPGGLPRVILMASGSEVPLILEAQKVLSGKGIAARVVSFPCLSLFEEEARDYREQVLPPDVRARLAVEAGSPLGWHRWVGDGGEVIGLDRFGASAPGSIVLRELGFSVERVVERALALMRGQA